uniref:TAF3 RNA polymerase II, TATA box binding protein (TBP)-associated facto n=1 Tax=Erpetoichthys calabaricus TaxID=27687 RepID=A0A8C4TEP4_ERPCA
MQVPLEEEEDEMEDDEAVNDENILGKRQLESPESVDMPVAKRPKLAGIKTESPERVVEMREPLTLINPQKVPPVQSPVKANDTSVSLPPSPEPPAPVPKVQLLPPKSVDPKLSTPKVKSKMNSSSQKTKSPKAANFTVVAGSPIRSPKPVPKEKKSPGRTKSPKSPKSPKAPLNVNHPAGKADTPIRTPLAVLSEKMGKENILLKQGQLQSDNEKDTSENLLKKLPEIDNTIDDSIDAVIARACAEREPDPFAFSSGSESEGEIFTSPRRLTISEPLTPKVTLNANSSIKGNVTSVPPVGTSSSDNSWTMDDSINEVIRKVSLGTPSSLPPNPPYLSSPSASPPTPEPLLKLYEEKTKLATSVDVKKKLKKELKTKIKKKEKEKQKEKDREKEKGKEKNKDKIKDKEKDKEINKETKLQWKDLSKEDEQEPVKFKLKEFDESDTRTKAKDAPTKKEKDKHKDKKKDKEKGKKDKEKKEKGKDKAREEKLKNQGTLMSPKETQLPLFSAQAGVRLSSMLSTLSPILPEKLFEEKEKPKEKEKKKEKKEKKKKKDKEKEKDKEKVKDKEKEKEKEKKEKEKEKKEKEKDKEKDKHKHEKVSLQINCQYEARAFSGCRVILSRLMQLSFSV